MLATASQDGTDIYKYAYTDPVHMPARPPSTYCLQLDTHIYKYIYKYAYTDPVHMPARPPSTYCL